MKLPKLSNVYAVAMDQMPMKRFFINFFVSRNAWGLFHRNSHIAAYSGKPKVGYNTKATATKAADNMSRKNPDAVFKAYKCLWCDKFHIGRNRHPL